MSRIIFITGATSGIGLACAEIFAKNGDDLVINGRRQEKLDSLKEELENKYQTRIWCARFDVRDREAVFNSIANLPPECRQPDILINNAGLAAGKDLFNDADIDDWETMINTNINGVLYVTRALLPGIIAKKQGHIINIGSIAGDAVYPAGNVYCATKSAVEAISKAMRIDLLPHSIKVTNIKPGAVETEFSLVRFKGDTAKANATYEGYQPLSAAEVADTIFYCASLPAHVCINELTITCTAQADGLHMFKG